MRNETYYRTLMHLTPKENGVIELWGGPTWVFCATLRPEDRARLRFIKGAFLYNEEQRGKTFKAEVLLNGIPLDRFEMAFDCLAAVTVAGSRILLGDHIDRLVDESMEYGLPVRYLQPRGMDDLTANFFELYRGASGRIVGRQHSKQ